MISWMQRHKKYLVITIWISTIAFIGAGFVGWGQYSYGERSEAVANVGDVPITAREFQQTYGMLYSRYSQLFGGNFDEAKAKQFGLEQQALQQLIQQGLILNLAYSYDLDVSDEEIVQVIKEQPYFQKEGQFDKELYLSLLKQNNISPKEYESDIKHSLIMQKVMKLYAPKAYELEDEVFGIITSIADKIEYKVIKPSDMKLTYDDKALKAFWEGKKLQFKTNKSYAVELVEEKITDSKTGEKELLAYYEENKNSFVDAKGEVLSFKEAKPDIQAHFNEKEAKKRALKKYLKFKKGELGEKVGAVSMVIEENNDTFTPEIMAGIAELTPEKPYMKPKKYQDGYAIIKLVDVKLPQTKTYEQAQKELIALYEEEQRLVLTKERAEKELDSFKGTKSDFITLENHPLKGLNDTQSQEFVMALFDNDKQKDFIVLQDGTAVLYAILEQKLLGQGKQNLGQNVVQIKQSMLDKALLEKLKNTYPIEVFAKE